MFLPSRGLRALFLPNTSCLDSVEFLTRFYSEYFPSRCSNGFSSWMDDVVHWGRGRNYRCHECTRARQLPGIKAGHFCVLRRQVFQFPGLETRKAAVIIQKGLRAVLAMREGEGQGGTSR